jgi:undecaprenyl diphosphate synthase
VRSPAARAAFRALWYSIGAAAAATVLADHHETLVALGARPSTVAAEYLRALARVDSLVTVDEPVTPVVSATRMPLAQHDLPGHVALIMDGNGRWAARRDLPRIEGHRVGADSVREIVRHAREIGIKALTLYAFSSQNWDRPREEVHALMGLLRDYLVEERAEILDNGIRLTTIGDVTRLPAFVREPLDALKADSAHNQRMTLCLALSYGGREAICDAARALAEGVHAGRLRLQDINLLSFGEALSTRGLPQLDLVIRTSGEQRISNFLLWEAAYAELYFTDTLWPDFRRADLDRALASYGSRERRFGLTSEQVLLRATASK